MKRECVITRLNGGLGNQLFQYAAGRALAEQLGVPLKMDISEFETYHLRSYELGKFNIGANFATTEDAASFIINPSRIQKYYCRLAIYLGLGYNKVAFKEHRFGYDSLFEKIRVPMYLNGYWQSEKYFVSIKEVIRKELAPIDKLSDPSQRIMDEIVQCASISLHIRRGDYISNPAAASVHGVCPLEYYYSAIQHICSHVSDPYIFVFSDDPQWARENLKISHPVRFVEANGPERSVEDMWLMKSCMHHIIANSSFSWWAAWLNGNQGKIIVAPRNWFLDKTINDRDLIPDEWQRI